MGISFCSAGIKKPEPKIGSCVELVMESKEYYVAENLQECDDWDKADFRIPMTCLRIPMACKVEVTGRTLQRRWTSNWVKVKVTWVGDCEPDVTQAGWMMVN